MNIGIDINSIPYNRGVSRYTSNLVRAFSQYPQHRLHLYGSSFRQKESLETFVQKTKKKSISKINSVIQPYPPKLLEIFWRFNKNKIKDIFPEVDVFHSWDWLQPPDTGIPIVSTIHDLAILKYPDQAHPEVVKRHKHSWHTLLQKQSRIIAVSRTTKKDLIELVGYPSFLIDVIYEALPEETRQITQKIDEEEAENIKKQLNLTDNYILFVGTREPRKNLVRLIDAWEPLSKDVKLIIAGDKGWDQSETIKLSAKAQDRLVFLGRVTSKELSMLYAEAQLLVYPSLYEGFGLPILEAFHHGTPVVTSDISAMPEVAGNAAEYVDPLDTQSIRRGIKKVLGESIQEQQKRLQRMIIRQQMFNWDITAKQTLIVYKKAIEQFT